MDTFVKYLHSNRTEGCTVVVVEKALKNGFLEVVRFLYAHYRSLFSPQLLHDLLLRGAFDIWMELRQIYPDKAAEGVELALVNAGAEKELVTIHFIVHELGRNDLAHVVVDAAADSGNFFRHSQWPQVVRVITGPGSCHLSAVPNAVSSTDVPQIHPLLLDPRYPGWAVNLALSGSDRIADPYLRCQQPVPWAIQAIYRADRLLLEILQVVKRDDRIYSFEGARAAAIRAGYLPLVQWLLTNNNLPVGPTLLDEALYHHEFELTEWLVANCLDGCREFNGDNKVDAG